jgi:hypothetical protein
MVHLSRNRDNEFALRVGFGEFTWCDWRIAREGRSTQLALPANSN